MGNALDRYYAPAKGTYKNASGQKATEQEVQAMDDFWNFIGSDSFSCTGGKATRNRLTFRSGFHGVQGTKEAAESLAAHLVRFKEERKSKNPDLPFLYCVYAAFFEGPEILSEKQAHDLVWQQLQHLHVVDMEQFEYAEGVSSDVTSVDFSYSVAGERYMVPSLNPYSSRLTRRYQRPVMVFIPREQFHHIYDNGIYKKMQEVIRAHDIKLQGTHNPMLDLHETSSDAVTFSGMAVKSPQECPFQYKGKK
ncbi:MAG: hypothetical protein EBQ96_07350 [Proteobacteria bacterium]|nr:hypothetical protein [Pseudomonadota bacterium]